jgi:glycosyltransferase involved in cell wall biosynthesis
VKVVPYGANIECNRATAEIERLIDARPTDRCKLLFLAVDWNRKGGPLACALARKLNDTGLPTDLNVVGCQPPKAEVLPPYVHLLGFVPKSTPEGRRRIDFLLSEIHFLILPSLADCTPIVLPEANSFGVPCLTTKVGGIHDNPRRNQRASVSADRSGRGLLKLRESTDEFLQRLPAIGLSLHSRNIKRA